MNGVLQDLTYGVRMLARSPGVTLVAVLTLALGIGLSTAVFSIAAPMISPVLPFDEPGRLYLLLGSDRESRFGPLPVTPQQFAEWQKDNTAFDSMALFGWPQGFHLAGGDEPEQLRGSRVSAEFFPLLGAQLELGRVFRSDEDKPGNELLVVLSHRLWQRRFSGDRGVLGRAVRLNGESCTVIGVLAEEFNFPSGAELWVPLTAGAGGAAVLSRPNFMGIARLKAASTPEQAHAQMDNFAARLAKAFPETHADFRVVVARLRDAIVPDYGMMAWTLFGAVAFVLLIACTNVANLLLARFARREREMTVRAAMGAGRTRLLRQLLTESVLLATAGATLGLLFTAWTVDATAALITGFAGGNPANPPAARIDSQVFLFTVALTGLTVVLFGLAPALSASKPDLVGVLKEGAVQSGAMRTRLFRNALVAGEMALALVLLCGAGLSMQSLLKFRSIDLGFNPAGVYSIWLNVPEHRQRSPGEVRIFTEALLERLGGTAGGQAAAATVRLDAPRDRATGRSFTVETQAATTGGEGNILAAQAVTPGYFETMQIPLLEGRLFTEQERADGAPLAVINQRLAGLYFPHGRALGQRIKLGGPGSEQPWVTVVGVVGDTRHPTWYELSVPTLDLYLPLRETASRSVEFLVRTAADSDAWPGVLRSAVWEVDPQQPVPLLRPMEQILYREVQPWQAMAVLLGLFAGGALLLGAIGLYSVMSYIVSQRVPEIGLRMALGANRRNVVRLVVSEGMKLALAGAALGLAGSFALTRVLAGLLYDISPTDPATLAAASLALLAVAWLATLLPARRAARVDPLTALRYE
jgi:putative ABC transport system permease protein